MKYTNYYITLLNTEGVLHLPVDQTKRLYNILIFEDRINTIKSLGITGHTVFMKIDSAEKSILKLSKGKDPEELFKEMILLSDSYYKNS